MASPTPPETTADTPVFRPSKKRKIYRQRAVDDDLPTTLPTPSDPQSLDELISHAAEDVEATSISMAEILRLRKKNSRRAGGVEFRAESGMREVEDGEGGRNELVRREEGGEVVSGVPRKFAPQTGTVGDVNRHMMEYIDSEMARRRAGEEGLQISNSTAAGTQMGGVKQTIALGGKVPGTDVQRQPATLGKLVEIDLGEEARQKNEERTRRKLIGEAVDDDEEGKVVRKPKVRLGRDGKPWRGRKRRGSEDVKRDQLVEEVLRENRLEIYEESTQPAATGDDQAADDRIAEAFRQEFMDAVAQRRQKKAAPPAATGRSTTGGKKEEEVLKGPKLGGSRNARAAMRDLMLKAGKK